jgi:WD40 repeat protein
MSRQTIFGTFCIAALVIAAGWIADHPALQQGPQSTLRSAGASCPPEAAVMHLDWSADGRSLFYQSRGLVEGESTLRIQALVPGGPWMSVFIAERAIIRAALAPDGRHVLLATGGELSWMESDSFASATLLSLPPELQFTDLAVFDNRTAAAATHRGTIYVVDPGGRTVGELATGQGVSIYCLRFSSDGTRLVSGSAEGSLTVWDLASRSRLQSLEGHGRSAAQGLLLPDGQRVISAGFDDTIRIWKIASGSEEWRKECGVGGVRTLDLSPDGLTAALAGFDRKVVVWDLAQGRKKFEFTTQAPFLSSVRFAPDGAALAVAGGEASIRIFDMQKGAEQTIGIGDSLEPRDP